MREVGRLAGAPGRSAAARGASAPREKTSSFSEALDLLLKPAGDASILIAILA